jgi:Ca2+-binding RTX toxin-like protein
MEVLRLPVVLALVVCSSLSRMASASTASVTGGQLSVSAAAGEVNDITIWKPVIGGTSYYAVTDFGVTAGNDDILIMNGGGCSIATVDDDRTALCLASTVSSILVDASDGDDTVTLVEDDVFISSTLNGGDGNDELVGGSGSDTMSGGAGADRLCGGPGNDSLNGGSGNDNLQDGTGACASFEPDGADTFDSGGGFDRIDYSARSTAIAAKVGQGSNGEAGEGDTIVAGTYHLIGTIHADVLVGGSGNDILEARDNVDSGVDAIDGGLGADGIYGGAGIQVAWYAFRSNPVRVTPDAYGDDGEAGEYDLVRNDVEWVFGGSGNDVLSPSQFYPSYVIGGAGDDRFIDPVRGSKSSGDHYSGGSGIDSIDYSQRTANIGVDLRISHLGGEAGENDLLDTDIENAFGGAGDDGLVGSPSANNALVGCGGNDQLIDEGGVDLVLDFYPGLCDGGGTNNFIYVRDQTAGAESQTSNYRRTSTSPVARFCPREPGRTAIPRRAHQQPIPTPRVLERARRR